MPEVQVNGRSVEVTDEGFLTNPTDWSREVTEIFAEKAGIQLTDRHWTVIEFCPGFGVLPKLAESQPRNFISFFQAVQGN